MSLNIQLPKTVAIKVGDQVVTLKAFDATEPEQHLAEQAVNIIASGPSVAELSLAELQHCPTIFVNGSISLTGQQNFSQVVGYVISDARFIHHKPEILQRYYKGQPLYATLAVLEAIAFHHPEIMLHYHDAMRILYPVNRPWGVKSNHALDSKLPASYQWLNKNESLSCFSDDSNFVIINRYQPAPIGVSLNISHGFVEAGTVAYVATQLAFARSASVIHLYGIDLLNNHQPRFYEHPENSAPTKLDEVTKERIVPSFNLLGRVYKEQGVSVINHSRISKALFATLG
ncbi:hypothetical protein [Oceanisphaera avium]|uniref:Lipopolysaccharide core biosynthesis protein n=1 Tax=Oceanisphaera avium TaxID=1903694 RepID=A0A1Y0CYE8_9GAMM|nr:hypothetical protein [Oceanisphaera avium]ART79927.1 hypothetical protein CBP12_06995 [Oceanisphaera avium]